MLDDYLTTIWGQILEKPKMIKSLSLFVVAFILGILTTSLVSVPAGGNIAIPSGTAYTHDLPSPQDHISEDDILVYKDRVVIRVQNPQWSSFSDTKSMDPVLDKGHNAIQVVPKSMDDIAVGDIISYKSRLVEGTIIHRVLYKGADSEGEYLILKGDNNPSPDPEKVRFSQVQRMVIAIIY